MLHPASCVAIDGQAILIEGDSGSGKSSLALSLIDRGAKLVSDDIVSLVRTGKGIVASSAPNIAGKLEIRNLGIVEMPATSAQLALVITLDPKAERFIDKPDSVDLLGVACPMVRLYPDTPYLPVRAEWALRQFGMG